MQHLAIGAMRKEGVDLAQAVDQQHPRVRPKPGWPFLLPTAPSVSAAHVPWRTEPLAARSLSLRARRARHAPFTLPIDGTASYEKKER
jgi:hypothetical protein